MQITTSTPRVAKTYADIPFSVPQPYAEGYVLTATDAAGVNSLVAQRWGNSQAGAIRRELQALGEKNIKLCKAKSPDALYDTTPEGKRTPHKFTIADLPADRDWQAEFDALVAEFELGVSNRGTGGSGSDPVERLATNLSSEAVKAELKKRGYNIRQFILTPAADGVGSALSKLTRDYLAKHPELREAAKAQLASLSTSSDGGVFDNLPEAEAA